MSTFNGEINEIAGIAVDYFENAELKCYFLSHCHTDHTKGLEMLQTDAPIYTTAISALIIRSKCPHLKDNIRELEMGIPTAIELDSDDGSRTSSFVVTAISAGHCAGACQLLFQTEWHDILYTGDFRMSLKNVQNITLLSEIKNRKNVVAYIDSTFMKSSFRQFPTQTDSVNKIVEVVGRFLEKSSRRKGLQILDSINFNFVKWFKLILVHLRVPARYGYEYLLMELSHKLKEKIHIQEAEVYDQYTSISILSECVTNVKHNAKIFLKPKYISSTDEPENDDTLCLQLSAMFWEKWTDGSPFMIKIASNSYRVCYATHNSFSEIKGTLSCLSI